MGTLREIKAQFLKDVVQHGVEKPPQKLMQQWIEEFREPLEAEGHGRLANRFTIGVETEVCLRYGLPGVALVRDRLGFIQNGDSKARIITEKNRSCLAHVAAVWRALQLLTGWNTHGDLVSCAMAGGRIALNSSVHFGRFGPKRFQEVQALDAVYSTLLQAQVLDWKNNPQRQQGDYKYRRFGYPGDIRGHGYGYEYRSLPSFVDSPAQIMLVVTLLKLAVLSSEEVSVWENVEGKPVAKILNLLAKFKGLDDDARFVYWMVCKFGLPTYADNDLWQSWELTGPQYSLQYPMPLTIEATEDWVKFTKSRLQRIPAIMPTGRVWWKTWASASKYAGDTKLKKILWNLRGTDSEVYFMNNPLKTGEKFHIETDSLSSVEQTRLEKIAGERIRVTRAAVHHPTLGIDKQWFQRTYDAAEKIKLLLKGETFRFYEPDETPVEAKPKQERAKTLYKNGLLSGKEG